MKPHNRLGRGILSGLLLVLSACEPIPDRINFLTDGRVLRGVYEGMGASSIDDETLSIRLEALPSYFDQNYYDVVGTVRLGEGEAIPFEGQVFGGDTQIYVLIGPTLPAAFDAQFIYEGEPWDVNGTPNREEGDGDSRVSWNITFGPSPHRGTYQAKLVPTE